METRQEARCCDFFTKRMQRRAKRRPSRHEYFTSHQCLLTPEKLNSYEIKCSRFKMFLFNITTVNMADIRARTMYRSYAALCAEKYRQYKDYPVSLHPFSKMRGWIEAFMCIILSLYNIQITIHVTEKALNGYHRQIVALYVCDLIYLMNIIVNFFTGYVEGNTCPYVVFDKKKIAIKYAKTWLSLDIISTFFLMPGIVYIQDVILHLVLLSTKLLRVPIIFRYLKNMLTVMKAGLFKSTLIEIIFLNVIYLSWNVYFQFAVEYMREKSFDPRNPKNCSWITSAGLWNATVPGLRLSFAFDRAVGMLRKNSNINFLEQNECFENFFVTSWIIAKILTYHCTLKYIVTLLGKESATSKFFIMTKQVEMFMKQRKFPPRIKEKILKFYAIRFQSNFFAETEMLKFVTGQLREDILMHTGRQLVRELEFLKQLPRELLLQIVLNLKIVIFIAGDIIYKINTTGDCLYFIDKGTVAIYSESGCEICHLEDGDYFGEIALVMKRPIRTASAVAVTNCELFRLDKEDFNSSIACYPTVYDDIKKLAMSRYERTCVLDEHHKAELQMADEHVKKGFSDIAIETDIGQYNTGSRR